MIDEKSRRKPGVNFDECAPVEFGDGREWLLPRPTFDIFAVFDGAAASEAIDCSFGPAFQAMVNAALSGGFAEVATLAADLLRRNYELSDAELSGLLRYRAGDRGSASWMGAVYAVAQGGEAPKPPGDGSGSPSA